MNTAVANYTDVPINGTFINALLGGLRASAKL